VAITQMITDTRLVRRWFGRLLQAWWIDLQFDSNGKVETGTGRRVAEACDDKLTKEMA
jgi:hypothetical protein